MSIYIYGHLVKLIIFWQCNYKPLADMTIQNKNLPKIKMKSDFDKLKTEEVNVN